MGITLAYIKRKQEQAENKELYEKSLEDMKEIILDEEGPEKRDEFREERTLWVTDQIAQGKFPEDLEDFYAMKKPSDEDETGGDAKDGKGKKDDKKGGKDKKEKGKKGKDKGVDDNEPAMPKLQGKTETTNGMVTLVNEFEGTWENKDESDNFQQKHDVDLSKQVVRPIIRRHKKAS